MWDASIFEYEAAHKWIVLVSSFTMVKFSYLQTNIYYTYQLIKNSSLLFAQPALHTRMDVCAYNPLFNLFQK